jgi:hypothetical protein
VSGAAYSKPVSALQRSISHFLALFHAMVSGNRPMTPHMSGLGRRPALVGGTERAIAAFTIYGINWWQPDRRST